MNILRWSLRISLCAAMVWIAYVVYQNLSDNRNLWAEVTDDLVDLETT